MDILGNITQELKVTYLTEYLKLKYPGIDFDDQYDDFESFYEEKQNRTAGEIIALQCAVILAWQTPHLCGSNVDYLRSLVREKKKQYKEVAGEDYIDYNEGSNGL